MQDGLFKRTSLVLALTLALCASPKLVFADDTNESEPQSDGPTPVEQLAPSGEGSETIQGTEPLYDKGVTITEIEITGNKLVPGSKILQAMETRPGSLYSKSRLQDDLKKIYDMGYFTEHLRVVPVATRDGVHLKIELEENPVVNKVSVEGTKQLKADELEALFKDQIGMPQNVNMVNKGIQSIEEKYKDQGYVLARVSEIKEDPPGTIHLSVDEGRISKITFTGNRKTRDYVIRRAMAQKEGDVYNEKTVAEDMKRIFSIQTFSDVRRVVKASSDEPGTYDLGIEVDEKKTGAVSVGGGIDTGTGVFGSVGYSDPNFLGRGQDFSSIFSIGSGFIGNRSDSVRKPVLQFQTSLNNPSLFETTNSLGISAFARRYGSYNVPLAVETRYGGSVAWARPLESLPGSSIGTEVGYEQVRLTEGAGTGELAGFGITPSIRAGQLDDGGYAYVSPSFNLDTRNNRFSPNSGGLYTLTSKAAFGTNTTSYGNVTANLRRYLRVTDGITLAVNGQAGSTFIGDVPAFNAFRMGGAYSVRGFQEGGIGIGQDYVLGSVELRTKLPFLRRLPKFPFYDMISGALFADAGRLFTEFSTNDYFKRPGYGFAYGAGLRANIPAVGPLRIDWAVPIGNNKGTHVQHFNFGVGQKF